MKQKSKEIEKSYAHYTMEYSFLSQSETHQAATQQ